MNEDDARSFSIEYIASSAAKFLKRQPRKRQEAIARAFENLLVSPLSHPNPTVIKPLKGKYKGMWRYRIGGVRIIYSVDIKKRTIHVAAIDNRGDVY